MQKKTKEIQLSVVQPADAGLLVRHLSEIYTKEAHLISKPHEYHASQWQQRSWINAKLKNPLTTCFIVKMGHDFAGMIYNWSDPRERVRHVTSFTMTVDSRFRRKGIGALLLGHFMRYVHEHPILEKIELHVHSDNIPAQKLYEKMGFTKEGIRKKAVKYEDGRVVDDILMACWPSETMDKSFQDYINNTNVKL